MLADLCAGKPDSDLLFTSPLSGGHLRRPDSGRITESKKTRKSWFMLARKRVGLSEFFIPHDLRHTAASLAISAGVDIKAVQRMLGHASAAMTLDTYADLFEDDLDGVAERLSERVLI
ncbi:tyrosine-type recombinase/integrase [Lysinibacter sp. HNR]|uniref:tyrosine-type recombinase/integrase n=1 Tax=Lysinibacter sp. HNR TaxID=3031408 RepID=UPI002435DB0D|nr:tyrosine-type recombinase/integrase [Lysinibacter sp. HNR]WGD36981.1 tyrosine-type recombinase/integrase [Lysinibacter sp. HNR]